MCPRILPPLLTAALTALASPPTAVLAQRPTPTGLGLTGSPGQIVLETRSVDWCFDRIRGRVDLPGPVRRRVGIPVTLEAWPRGLVTLPGRVIARPWASFTIRGRHSMEVPPRTVPRTTRVTIRAKAGRWRATETFAIRATPGTRRTCLEKIREADPETYERLEKANREIDEMRNRQASEKESRVP